MEAVDLQRSTSGSSSSGLWRWPTLAWSDQSRLGLYWTRAEYESSDGLSIFHRCSSGSLPRNALASTFHPCHVTPPVTTPNAMWVESSQWWEIGASGIS